MQRQGWGKLPDGSSLDFKLTGSDPNFTAVGQSTQDGNFLERYTKSDLTNGIRLPLRSPHIYQIEIDIFFNGAATTTVSSSGGPKDPAGNPLGTPLGLRASGINGDHDTLILKAFTQL